MAQQPLPPPPHPPRNMKVIAIAVAVIAIIAIASVAAVIVLNPFKPAYTGPPFDFNLRISDTSGYAMQGGSLRTTIYITTTQGNPETVTLVADGGSSGIHCGFNPVSNTPDFTSTLNIDIPSYTNTGSYSVTITASGGGKTYSTSYTVSVLSAKVYVSGTVTTTGLGTNPSEIKFVDTQSGITYTGSLSGNSYSATLDNHHTYAVTVTWTGLLYSTGTFSGGNLYVDAPVGYTTMSKSFSG